jgi:hypothetical protein
MAAYRARGLIAIDLNQDISVRNVQQKLGNGKHLIVWYVGFYKCSVGAFSLLGCGVEGFVLDLVWLTLDITAVSMCTGTATE